MARALIKDRVAAELAAIQARDKDNVLHASKVVEWAKAHTKSALHSQFEWSDTKAANEYRLWQARRLIMVTINETGAPPVIVSLRYDRARGGGYRQTSDVVESKELSDMMLADAVADLERVRERHEHVKELVSVWEALDDVKAKTKRRRAREPARASA